MHLLTFYINLGIQYDVEKLGLNRIVIKAAKKNKSSCEIAKRLGFKKEAVLRQSQLLNGMFHDIVVFSLLRQDFEKIKKRSSSKL